MLPSIRRSLVNLASHSQRHLTSLASTSKHAPLVQAGPHAEPHVYITMCNLTEDVPPDEAPIAVLDPSVFAHPIRRDILYLCVNFYRDALRQGSASTKTRGEVAGSGRKIRPQKGSGKARLGDAQSPMLRGGGVAFGPKPRSFATDLPRKVRQMGMRVALSARVAEGALAVAPSLAWPGAKTGAFANRLAALGWRSVSSRTLLVAGADAVPPRLARVARNLTDVDVRCAADLHVYELLRWPRVVLDVDAVAYLERLLGKNVPEAERIPIPSPPLLRYSRMEAGRKRKTSPTILGIDNVASGQSRQLVNSDALFE